MRSRAVVLLASLLLLAPVAAHAVVRVPTNFENEIIAFGLSEPNSMAFLPDGRILVTEQRTGRIRMVVGSLIASKDPALQVMNVEAGGYEQGLQGIAVDPAWPDRPYIYIFYNAVGGFARVERYTGVGDVTAPLGQNLSFVNPVVLLDGLSDAFSSHNGGCLRFGPDGHLYLSLGDDESPCAAKDSTTLQGAILRLRVGHLDGTVSGTLPRSMITPFDNPLVTTNANAKLVWAFGFRNPWRFHIDPVTGKVFTAEVGLLTYEELNEVVPGQFYGWPWREGPQVMPRPSCPEPGGNGAGTYKTAAVDMLRDPDILVSISSAGIYRQVIGASHNWPYDDYDGDVFYGEYYTGDFWRLKNVKGTWTRPPAQGQPDAQHWATGIISGVDFLVGADGSMYWLAQYDSTLFGATGSIQRIRYVGTGGTNDVPEAQLASRMWMAAIPNPSRDGAVQVAFRMPVRAQAKVELFDLAGRRIRTLMKGDLAAGDQRARWDGKDSEGKAVKPGVYLARVDYLGGSKTIRLLRLQ